MSKGVKVIAVLLGIFLIFVMMLGGVYNSIMSKDETVSQKLSDVSVQLERRADLIPNLVNTVKGYVTHEENVINSITRARENLTKASTVEDMAKANDELTSAINGLYVIVENYPDLKANTNFISLQDELAGTENRIAVARKDYNDAVSDYNKTIKSFPKNIVARMFNFTDKTYFESKSTANEVPNVSFE